MVKKWPISSNFTLKRLIEKILNLYFRKHYDVPSLGKVECPLWELSCAPYSQLRVILDRFRMSWNSFCPSVGKGQTLQKKISNDGFSTSKFFGRVFLILKLKSCVGQTKVKHIFLSWFLDGIWGFVKSLRPYSQIFPIIRSTHC